MKNIYITSLELWNVKGFEHFKAALGMFNVVKGTNGAGKTSFTMGCEMFFMPGSDPRLIRRGCDEAKGRVTFSNGYSAIKIVRKDSYKLDVFNPEGGICAAPATILSQWLPRNSFDASIFLDNFDITKRTEFILANLPVGFSVASINAVLATKFGSLNLAPPMPLLPDGPDKSLDDFDKFFDEVDSARAAINREIDKLKAAAALLQDSLPQDMATDWKAVSERLQDDLTVIDKAIAASEADIKLEAEQARTQKRETLSREIGDALAVVTTYRLSADAFAQKTIAFANASTHVVSQCRGITEGAGFLSANADEFVKAAKNVKLYETELTSVLKRIDEAEAAAIAEEKAKKATERSVVAQSLGEAREKAAQQERGKGVKDALDKQRAALKGETIRYEHISAVIDGLKRLKAEKMRAVDIDGFDIKWEKAKGARKESAVILIDGLPLDELNRQQALFVALKLVVLAQKANTSEEQLPLVIMETAELVESNRQQLKEAVERAGMQLVITVPEDGMDFSLEALA